MADKKKYSTSQIYGERTRFQYLDIIISSGAIKKQFIERCQELKVSPYTVALATGVSYHAMKHHYINNPCPSASHNLSQEKFLNMLEAVGIDIRVIVKVSSVDEAKERMVKYKVGLSKKDKLYE